MRGGTLKSAHDEPSADGVYFKIIERLSDEDKASTGTRRERAAGGRYRYFINKESPRPRARPSHTLQTQQT